MEHIVEVVRFTDFKLAWLQTFVCVVRLGGFQKAADYLGISQSTATRQVGDLKNWFGREILTNNRPPRMTAYGEKIYKLSEEVIFAVCNANHLLLRATRTELGSNRIEFADPNFNDQELENMRALRIFLQG